MCLWLVIYHVVLGANYLMISQQQNEILAEIQRREEEKREEKRKKELAKLVRFLS